MRNGTRLQVEGKLDWCLAGLLTFLLPLPNQLLITVQVQVATIPGYSKVVWINQQRLTAMVCVCGEYLHPPSESADRHRQVNRVHVAILAYTFLSFFLFLAASSGLLMLAHVNLMTLNFSSVD